MINFGCRLKHEVYALHPQTQAIQQVVLLLVSKSCPTLCNPMDYNPPGSSVHGILQARILKWVAIPSPGDLPNPGFKPGSPALQADSLPTEPAGKPQHSRKRCHFHAHPSSSTRDLSWRNKFVRLCGDVLITGGV